jgi:hypothetical protein
MTLDDLKHIFKHQLTPTEDYVPKDTLDYMLFEGMSKIQGSCPVNDLEKLIPLLDNFILDGYRDKMPLFIKPENVI